MKTQHTPGPWQWDDIRDQIMSMHEDWRFSLICMLATGEDRKQENANARLIAAAPDLLDACKDAFLLAHPCPECGQVELLGEGLARCPCADRPWDWRDVAPIKDGWKSCRDAIAKAEGRS